MPLEILGERKRKNPEVGLRERMAGEDRNRKNADINRENMI